MKFEKSVQVKCQCLIHLKNGFNSAYETFYSCKEDKNFSLCKGLIQICKF